MYPVQHDLRCPSVEASHDLSQWSCQAKVDESLLALGPERGGGVESAIAKVNALISILFYTADEINHKTSE